MDERVRFVGRLLDGEKMAALCREFAISRKTGYKIFDRYKEHGLEALTDRSRRPWRYANLAGQLYGVRSRLHRGGKNSAASRQPVWLKSVTYVSGTICHPCLRAGPGNDGRGARI